VLLLEQGSHPDYSGWLFFQGDFLQGIFFYNAAMIHTDYMVATIQDKFRIMSNHEQSLASVCKSL
jgi:hypothetical protein